MKTAVLEALSLGDDLDLSRFSKLNETIIFPMTDKNEVVNRIKDCEAVIINKTVLTEENLSQCPLLKLICITATGYDNVDIEYCKKNGIAVCNVPAYSTNSVSQLTVAMVLYLSTKLEVYRQTIVTKMYQNQKNHNILKPVFHEISSKTWGIIGYGNIGKQVAKAAEAMGCETVYYKKHPTSEKNCISLEELCEKSDIISVHIPLNNETRKIIDEKLISVMKKDVIFINVSRGAVTNEKALANAIKTKKIGALGCDVFSKEPLSKDNPLSDIAAFENVCLTPHMGWGAYESRERCMKITYENIEAFMNGEIKNRLD